MGLNGNKCEEIYLKKSAVSLKKSGDPRKYCYKYSLDLGIIFC